MCFVGFVYFGCGHSRIIYQDCELARQADIAFWNRELCPNRHSASEHPKYLCGQGRFYCSESPDGALLDLACSEAREAAADMARIDALLVQSQGAAGALVARMNAASLPQHQRDRHPLTLELMARHANLTTQKLALHKKRSDAERLLQQAQGWYKNRLQHQAGQRSGPFPTLVSGLDVYGKAPSETIGTPSVQGRPNEAGYIGIPILRPEQRQLMTNVLQPNPAAPAPALTTAAQGQSQRGSGDGLSALHNLAQQAEEARRRPASGAVQPPRRAEQSPTHSREVAASESAEKPSKRRAVAKELDDKGADEGSIRRSARVRGKKVNYAESLGSVSREASPDKSDGFGPSPEKSKISDFAESDEVEDDNESPLKRGRGRPKKHAVPERAASPFLSERMNDYVKRTAAARSGSITKPRCGMESVMSVASSAVHSSAPAQYSLPQMAQTIANPGMLISDEDLQPPLAPPLSLHRERRQMGRPPTLPSRQPSLGNQSGSFPSMTAYGAHGPHAGPGRQTLPPPQYMSLLTPAPLPCANLQGSMSAPSFSFATALRRDSLNSSAFTVTTPHSEQAESHYEGMRRSLGTPIVLTSTVNARGQIYAMEPRKRSLPPSSPALQPAKRMRLSLLGDGPGLSAAANDWLLSQPAELPSPEKYSVQDGLVKGGLRLPSPQSMLAGSDNPAPMLAPILRPTPTRPPRTTADETIQAAAVAAEGTEVGNEENEAAPDEPHPFVSDIDWGFGEDGPQESMPW